MFSFSNQTGVQLVGNKRAKEQSVLSVTGGVLAHRHRAVIDGWALEREQKEQGNTQLNHTRLGPSRVLPGVKPRPGKEEIHLIYLSDSFRRYLLRSIVSRGLR